MKTIKLPYTSDTNIDKLFKQYSIIVRFSYNRFLEGKNEKEIRLLTKELNNIELLNSWIIQCGIKDAWAIHKRFKDKKIVFGGEKNLLKYNKKIINKDEFQLKRLCPINIQGEQLQKGNRSFKLDLIDNNSIIFKLNKKEHISFLLPKLRKNLKKDLFKLQQLNDVKSKKIGYTYSIRFDSKFLYISFEEFKEVKIELKSNRYLGIDLNPENIGISILEDEKIIYTREFSLSPIFKKIFSDKTSSNDSRMKYFQNKLKHETLEISKIISNLANNYKCQTVYLEDLNFKSTKLSGPQKYNNKGNRKNKNLWKRELFRTNLKKRLNIFNIQLFDVNPAYSSFIGNMKYSFTDPVNASIEIARRGYSYRIKKEKDKFYPSFDVKHQWKEMATSLDDWKEFYLKITKNLKMRYRVSLTDVKYSVRVFQQSSSHKSMVLNYTFYE